MLLDARRPYKEITMELQMSIGESLKIGFFLIKKEYISPLVSYRP
jgi:hypothetical protein